MFSLIDHTADRERLHGSDGSHPGDPVGQLQPPVQLPADLSRLLVHVVQLRGKKQNKRQRDAFSKCSGEKTLPASGRKPERSNIRRRSSEPGHRRWFVCPGPERRQMKEDESERRFAEWTERSSAKSGGVSNDNRR